MSAPEDVATRCATIALAVVGHADLDAAVADVLALPATLAARGLLATGLVEALVRSDPTVSLRRLRELDDLLRIATEPQPPNPQWVRTRTVAKLLSLTRGVAERETTDFDGVNAQIGVLWAEVGEDPTLKPLFDSAHMGVQVARSLQEGDVGAMARLPADVQRFLEGMPQTDPRLRSIGGWLSAQAELMAAGQRGEDVTERISQLADVTAGLPMGDLRAVGGDFLHDVSTLLAAKSGEDGTRLTDEQLARLITEAETADLSAADRALRHSVAAQAALGGGAETDLGRVDIGVTQLRKALDCASGMQPEQSVMHLTGLALGLFRRSELTNSTDDLREAEQLLLHSREVAGGAGHPQWQIINGMLTDVRKLLGTDPGFQQTGVEGLQSNLWQVLLQPDPIGVAAAARDAATDAMEVARRCLAAADPAGAITALDAGRGLALFAATEVRSIGDRLDDVGATELARRWREAVAEGDPAKLATDLRREALAVLEAHSSAADLLEPPELGEIQRALAALDADALVYLLPGSGPYPGYLLAAPTSGLPSFMALTELRVDGEVDVERYLTALARRDAAARDVEAEPPTPDGSADDDQELAQSLDALCDWAWRAAMGALIETYLPRLPLPAGRPRRVVLIPMGDLARIPWQAARGRDDTYAVERIAISQAASARMLCAAAALPPVAPSAVGLVVGDPPTAGAARPLPAARLEAYAIQQVFYPGARYLGHRPDKSISPSGAGTRDQVTAWLADTSPGAGTMLHLACHGFVRAEGDRRTAYLQLANREKLTAAELIDLLADKPERAIGLVVLAACSSGRSFAGYDEAYSLGTAFLAGGARSVFSSQWNIDDLETAAFMFMVHRFLRVEGRPPWAALRDAQLWMLAADRVIPEDMPRPLRARLDQASLAGVEKWAAFVHGGQ